MSTEQVVKRNMDQLFHANDMNVSTVTRRGYIINGVDAKSKLNELKEKIGERKGFKDNICCMGITKKTAIADSEQYGVKNKDDKKDEEDGKVESEGEEEEDTEREEGEVISESDVDMADIEVKPKIAVPKCIEIGSSCVDDILELSVSQEDINFVYCDDYEEGEVISVDKYKGYITKPTEDDGIKKNAEKTNFVKNKEKQTIDHKETKIDNIIKHENSIRGTKITEKYSSFHQTAMNLMMNNKISRDTEGPEDGEIRSPRVNEYENIFWKKGKISKFSYKNVVKTTNKPKSLIRDAFDKVPLNVGAKKNANVSDGHIGTRQGFAKTTKEGKTTDKGEASNASPNVDVDKTSLENVVTIDLNDAYVDGRNKSNAETFHKQVAKKTEPQNIKQSQTTKNDADIVNTEQSETSTSSLGVGASSHLQPSAKSHSNNQTLRAAFAVNDGSAEEVNVKANTNIGHKWKVNGVNARLTAEKKETDVQNNPGNQEAVVNFSEESKAVDDTEALEDGEILSPPVHQYVETSPIKGKMPKASYQNATETSRKIEDGIDMGMKEDVFKNHGAVKTNDNVAVSNVSALLRINNSNMEKVDTVRKTGAINGTKNCGKCKFHNSKAIPFQQTQQLENTRKNASLILKSNSSNFSKTNARANLLDRKNGVLNQCFDDGSEKQTGNASNTRTNKNSNALDKLERCGGVVIVPLSSVPLYDDKKPENDVDIMNCKHVENQKASENLKKISSNLNANIAPKAEVQVILKAKSSAKNGRTSSEAAPSPDTTSNNVDDEIKNPLIKKDIDKTDEQLPYYGPKWLFDSPKRVPYRRRRRERSPSPHLYRKEFKLKNAGTREKPYNKRRRPYERPNSDVTLKDLEKSKTHVPSQPYCPFTTMARVPPHVKTLYDENGHFRRNGADICDCGHERCNGCWYNCFECGSPKCGLSCRCRRQVYPDSWILKQAKRNHRH